MKKMSHGGYTLLEILVVLSVVVILMFVAMPIMTGFVRTTKKESAVANAALVYAIAENYLYDDIFVYHNDSYECKHGCEIPSSTTNLEQKPLVDLINAELSANDESYILFYHANGSLQVTYTLKDGTVGIYPALVNTETGVHTIPKVTTAKLTGTYPKISDLANP